MSSLKASRTNPSSVYSKTNLSSSSRRISTLAPTCFEAPSACCSCRSNAPAIITPRIGLSAYFSTTTLSCASAHRGTKANHPHNRQTRLPKEENNFFMNDRFLFDFTLIPIFHQSRPGLPRCGRQWAFGRSDACRQQRFQLFIVGKRHQGGVFGVRHGESQFRRCGLPCLQFSVALPLGINRERVARWIRGWATPLSWRG